jgi:hypothetical protein
MFAQEGLFSSTEALDAKIAFSPKKIRKSHNDTVYFDTPLQYKVGEEWQEMPIGIRARGNFRRSTCYYPPIKVDLKKGKTKGTLFKGQKKLKLVLPCLQQKDKNDNILKELMVYKLYELVTPYHFKTRRLSLQFTDQNKKKPVVETLNAFLIEDDKKIAKLHEGKVFERYIHPLAMDSDSSIRNAMFQYMIGNTDFSVAYQHNGKLLYIDKKIIPLPYDFDMSGFINPSYGVVNQTLDINSIRDRKYRGFKRDNADFYAVRDVFISQKEAMFSILANYQSSFQNPKEFTEAKEYLTSFFEIIEDEASFNKNVVDAARTK